MQISICGKKNWFSLDFDLGWKVVSAVVIGLPVGLPAAVLCSDICTLTKAAVRSHCTNELCFCLQLLREETPGTENSNKSTGLVVVNSIKTRGMDTPSSPGLL